MIINQITCKFFYNNGEQMLQTFLPTSIFYQLRGRPQTMSSRWGGEGVSNSWRREKERGGRGSMTRFAIPSVLFEWSSAFAEKYEKRRNNLNVSVSVCSNLRTGRLSSERDSAAKTSCWEKIF